MSEEEVQVQQNSEAEENARAQGWVPQEEWKGDPERWSSAEEFIERGEKVNGILKDRNKQLLSEVSALRAELRDSVRQFGESTRKAEERAYNKAIKDIQSQQRSAVEIGDAEAWQRLENEKDALSRDFSSAQQQQQQQTQQNSPIYEGWKSDNPWYESDVEATAYAESIAGVVGRRHSGESRSFYDEIAAEVKKKFPEKFRNPNRDSPSAVQSATTSGGKPQKKGKSYSDLPPEAKTACDRFVGQGVMSKEDYVKSYFEG